MGLLVCTKLLSSTLDLQLSIGESLQQDDHPEPASLLDGVWRNSIAEICHCHPCSGRTVGCQHSDQLWNLPANNNMIIKLTMPEFSHAPELLEHTCRCVRTRARTHTLNEAFKVISTVDVVT